MSGTAGRIDLWTRDALPNSRVEEPGLPSPPKAEELEGNGPVDEHGYYVLFGRGTSMHRGDCPFVGQPEPRFWKGPFSRAGAMDLVGKEGTTIVLEICEGNCTLEERGWLLDLEGY